MTSLQSEKQKDESLILIYVMALGELLANKEFLEKVNQLE